MRHAGVCLSLLSLTLGLSGCAHHTKSEKYYLIAGNLKLPYWKTVTDGFNKSGAQLGVTAMVAGPDTADARAEVDDFDKAVASKPAGILVSVIDASLMAPQINKAIGSGIPVITVDSDAADSSRLYFIGTNNLEAGRLGARRLADKLKGKGNIAVFSLKGQPNVEERLKGYLDVINEHAGMKVIDVFDVKSGTGTAFDKTRELLARTGNDKVDAFVSLDSASSKDVCDALDRQNVTDRTVIAMDATKDTLDLIQAGKIEATVSQKPYTMGYAGLLALAAVRDNMPASFSTHYTTSATSPYPVFVDTGTSLVDKSNVGGLQQPAASGAGGQ